MCPNCLGKYVGDETFDNHKRLCNELNDKESYIAMPEKGTFTKFDAHSKVHPATVVIYADTESKLNKTGISNENGNTKVICNHNAIMSA